MPDHKRIRNCEAPHIFLCTYPERSGREGYLAAHEAGLALLDAGRRELEGVHHNISHSGGLAVCAFAPEAVGVDIERIRPLKESTVKRVLSPVEYERFSSAGPAAAEVFIRFWTLKEAYGKQSGAGIAYPLSETCFSLPESFPPAGQCLALPSPVKGRFFYQWKLGEEYFLSLCCETEYRPEQITLHYLP